MTTLTCITWKQFVSCEMYEEMLDDLTKLGQ